MPGFFFFFIFFSFCLVWFSFFCWAYLLHGQILTFMPEAERIKSVKQGNV